MGKGLFLAAALGIAVQVERKPGHRLGQDTDAGIDRRHLHGRPLIHRLAAGGAPEEKAVLAAAQRILRFIPRLEHTGENIHRIKSPLPS